MDTAHAYSSDVAFTPAVKAVQARKGSRQAYERVEAKGGWQTRITPDLAGFIAAQTSAFLATASADGQPYIQHRGGPAGSCTSSTTRPSALPISPATGNSSPRAISRRIPRRICS
jgi:predicted pyridoxine 5'-phosphate oxidase superfamily flavin-nucleotide-binding protein